MATLLVKNGSGSPEDRKIFKELRTSLSEEQQVVLARKFGLELVGQPTVVAPPPQYQYTFDIIKSVVVAATSEEEAERLAVDLANSVTFVADDLSLEDTEDIVVDEDEDDEENEDEED